MLTIRNFKDMSSLQLIEEYIRLLLHWNKTYRLVGSRSAKELWEKHVVDAFVLRPFLKNKKRIVDLGTGAGIPGILVKILVPDCSMILIDSQRKRINFCEAAIRSLGLRDVATVCGRVEDKKVIASAGVADAVISKATWKLGDYVKLGSQYLGEGGTIFSLKGARWMDEIGDANEWSHNTLSVPYSTLSDGGYRELVIIKNVSRETFLSSQAPDATR